MMTKFGLLLVVAVLLGVCQEASTLKCWRCTNDAENAAFCNDPFDESAVTPEQRKWVYTECSNSPQPETKKPTSTTTIPVCKKVIEMIDNKSFVLRSCAWEDPNVPQEACKGANVPSDVTIAYCKTCTTDGCNSSSQKQ